MAYERRPIRDYPLSGTLDILRYCEDTLNYSIHKTSAIEYKAGSFPISHFAARSDPLTKASLLLAV